MNEFLIRSHCIYIFVCMQCAGLCTFKMKCHLLKQKCQFMTWRYFSITGQWLHSGDWQEGGTWRQRRYNGTHITDYTEGSWTSQNLQRTFCYRYSLTFYFCLLLIISSLWPQTEALYHRQLQRDKNLTKTFYAFLSRHFGLVIQTCILIFSTALAYEFGL